MDAPTLERGNEGVLAVTAAGALTGSFAGAITGLGSFLGFVILFNDVFSHWHRKELCRPYGTYGICLHYPGNELPGYFRMSLWDMV